VDAFLPPDVPEGKRRQTGETDMVVGSWNRGKMKSPTMLPPLPSKPEDSPMQKTGWRCWLPVTIVVE
jgi:hypothetical protein